MTNEQLEKIARDVLKGMASKDCPKDILSAQSRSIIRSTSPTSAYIAGYRAAEARILGGTK